jgi:hypothetical protein
MQKDAAEQRCVAGTRLKLVAGAGGASVTSQHHRLVDSLRLFVAVHQERTGQRRQDAEGATAETTHAKAAQSHRLFHRLEVIADLVEVAIGEECHIGQGGGEAQRPHCLDRGQERSCAEEHQTDRQDGDEFDDDQEQGQRPLLPQGQGADTRDDGGA